MVKSGKLTLRSENKDAEVHVIGVNLSPLIYFEVIPDTHHSNKQARIRIDAFLHAPLSENIGIPAQAGMPKTVSIE